MSDDRHWIAQRAEDLTDDLTGWRRHLHRNPEPSMQEHQTAAFVAEKLREMGVEQIEEGVGETGVVAILRGTGERCVALRADMDALELTEDTGADYASTIDGMMHACGHDVHTACLLGAAAILHGMGDGLPGVVKLIFQPGEEGAAGALRMIEDGCLRDPEPEAILAAHVNTGLEQGRIGLTRGFVTAQSDSVDMTIIGESSHAARPHQGVDAISLAAQAITATQHFVARCTDPLHRKVVTFGTIEGGRRRNIVADSVRITGTIRSYEAATREAIVDFLGNRLRTIIAELGGRLEITIEEGYPSLWNEDWVVDCAAQAAREVLGDEAVEEMPDPTMGAEDFAFFQHVGQLPAAMLRLGARHEASGLVHPVHTTRFDCNDAVVVPTGAAVYANAALKLLER
ncbi:MAG: M20 metallopeptidase family protein [Armatimonadota bacterium]